MNHSLLTILKHAETPLFVTGFYLVVDTARSKMFFANAAHPEPLLLHRHRGDLESISAEGGGGPPLGLLDDAHYQNREYPIAVDDLIMLFTDGLFEVPGPDNDMYSRERLVAAVRKRVCLPSAVMLAELFGEIRHFSKGIEFSDDVCLVAIDIKRLSDAEIGPAVQNRNSSVYCLIPESGDFRREFSSQECV